MRAIVVFLSALVLALGASPAWAQRDGSGPVRVSAQVESERVFVGQPFLLQISVEGDTRSQPPVVPPIPGARVEELGSSTSSEVVFDGQRTVERARRVFQYRLTPLREGQILIPPFEAQTRDGVRRSDPIVVEAVTPGEMDNFKLRLMTSKQRAYAGEPVTLRLTWFLGEEVRTAQFSMPDLPASFGVYAPADDGITPAHFQGGQYYEVSFLGERSVARAGRGEIDGRAFSTLTIEKTIVAREPGVYELGPATVAFTQTSRTRRRSLFDSPLFSGDSPMQVVASPPITLEVVPLPTQGRPQGFSGLVGRFAIETKAEPTRVRVGDPITLTVTVTGDGPPDEIPMLDLSRVPGFESAFRLTGDRPTVEPLRNGKRFSTMIRARDPGVTEVSPIELSYFDADAREFRVASSGPIPLSVEAAPRVTLPGAPASIVASATDRASTEGDASQANRETGARAVTIDDLSSRSGGILSLAWGPAGVAAVVLPPAACAAIVLGGAVRRRIKADPSRGRRARALREALGSIARVDAGAPDASLVASAISEAVRRFAADWTGSPRDAMTSDEAVRVVQRADEGAARELREALSLCDEVRFAGGHGFDAKRVAASVSDAITRADAALRATRGKVSAP